MGIDAASGELLWHYDREKPTAFIPSPIIADDLVFSVCGYGRGGALLQQVVGPENSISIKEIYDPDIQLSNKHGGVVLLYGFVYGGYEDNNDVYCADLMTGERKWIDSVPGSGSIALAAAEGMLYMRTQDGTMTLARASESGYEEISSFKTPGSGDGKKPSWAHPVIANGKLLLREGDTILCYDVSQSAVAL